MSVTTVNVNPFISNVRVLRPFDNFESVLQGTDPEKNHLICPGNVDPRAAQPEEGYAPNLNAGEPVQLGSKVYLWLPRILNGYGTAVPNYFYRVMWRLRAFAEAAQDVDRRLNGHLGERRAGRAQVGVPADAAKRFVIPTAYHTIQFNADQTGYDEGVGKLGTPPEQLTNPNINGVDDIDVNFATAQFKTILPGGGNSDGYWTAPPDPSFSGTRLGHVRIVSQGFYDDLIGDSELNAGFLGGPTHNIVMLPALGDEMIIEVFRARAQPSDAAADWDFSGIDAGLSTFLGNDNGNGAIPQSGIYVLSGM